MAMDNIGWKFYMLFVALNAVDFVVITLFFPETKGVLLLPYFHLSADRILGKTLEEMASIFGDEVDVAEVLGTHGKDKDSTEKHDYVHEA